jgi:hypothetical protein
MRIIEVNAEGCRVAKLGENHRVKVGIDLAL